MKLTSTIIAASITACVACTPSPKPVDELMNQSARQPAYLVIRNAHVIPDASSSAIENAEVFIRDDHIEYVGPTRDSYPKGTRIIDADGAWVLPGLVDAHAHMLGVGTALEQLNLVGTTSMEQIAEMVREEAQGRPAGEWIFGRGWDQNDWEDTEFPDKRLLDEAAPNNPVLLSRIDGHAILVSSRAMELAGVGPDVVAPSGGMIIRDETGAPSGIFIDNAESLIVQATPEPSPAIIRRRLELAAAEIARHGLTGIHEAGQDQEYIDILLAMDRDGELPIRVNVMLTDNSDLLDSWFDRGPLESNLVTVSSIKLYVDGALGSRGAALLENYDDADHNGLLTTSGAHIEEVAERAIGAGFQVNSHAIGDRGTRTVIEAYENAGVRPGHRFRIEHLQVFSLDDLDRIAKLGVIASMQPTHATSDMPWAERRLGPERVRGAYAWRKLLDAGVPLALGSDMPVESVDPRLGLYAAVTRQDLSGKPAGGWTPEERLTIEEALAGFTSGPAFASFREDQLGRVAKGMLADLVVLDRDPRRVRPDELTSLKVLHTISDGRVVFSAD